MSFGVSYGTVLRYSALAASLGLGVSKLNHTLPLAHYMLLFCLRIALTDTTSPLHLSSKHRTKCG